MACKRTFSEMELSNEYCIIDMQNDISQLEDHVNYLASIQTSDNNRVMNRFKLYDLGFTIILICIWTIIACSPK